MTSLLSAPRDLARGFAYVPRGYRFLRAQRSLWPWALSPALLTAAALITVPWLVLDRRAALVSAMWPEGQGAGLWGTLLHVAHGAFALFTALVLLALSLLAAAVLAALLAAPFNDLLSERVEALATGARPPPFRLRSQLRELARVLQLSALRAAVYTLLVIVGWLLAWALPGVGQLVHLALVVPITLAYLSLDQTDYAAARRGWPIARRMRLLRDEPALMLGFGASVWLCLCVPLVNVLFMPVSVTGGTLLVVDLQRAPPSA